jgi:16S rRNA (guanine966-N2)-methyltransferase
MRIIGGRHRGTKLADLVGDKTRPTADRVRESLFNILNGGRFGAPLDGGIVIDLFAGTGALGLEALSHGAAYASFVESDARALGVLRENISLLKRADDAAIIGGNAITMGNIRGDAANLVFADAPYGTGDGLRAVANLASIGALAPEALIVIETAKNEVLDSALLDQHHLTILEQRKYGKAMLHFIAAK